MTLIDHMAHSRATNVPCSFPPVLRGEKCPICSFDPLEKEHARLDKLEQELANDRRAY